MFDFSEWSIEDLGSPSAFKSTEAHIHILRLEKLQVFG